jgi:hypothetical protein
MLFGRGPTNAMREKISGSAEPMASASPGPGPEAQAPPLPLPPVAQPGPQQQPKAVLVQRVVVSSDDAEVVVTHHLPALASAGTTLCLPHPLCAVPHTRGRFAPGRTSRLCGTDQAVRTFLHRPKLSVREQAPMDVAVQFSVLQGP